MFRLTPLEFAFVAGILLLCSSAGAQPAIAAATLEAASAPVSINNGEGYREVALGATKVSDGTQVMAGAGGRARIVYSDGCVTEVYPGSVIAVGKCYQPMRAGLEAPVEEAHPIPWVPLLGAAAVIGVGTCAVAGCFDDDDPGRRPPRPKSP